MFNLTSTIYLLLRCSIEKQIQLYKHQNNSPYFSYFFSKFLSSSSRVFIFLVFCNSSKKLNNISCGICLSFKNRYVELFCFGPPSPSPCVRTQNYYRIFKWNYVIFTVKILIRKLFISNSKIFIYLLWPWKVLVLNFSLK